LGAKECEILHFRVVFTLFGQLKAQFKYSSESFQLTLQAQFTLELSNEHLKLAKQLSLAVLQHRTKFQVTILRGKNF